MKPRGIYTCLIMLLVSLCVLNFPCTLIASNMNKADKEFTQIYSGIKDIQSQLYAITERVYSNKVQNKSNDEEKKRLQYTITQVNAIKNELISDEKSAQQDDVLSAKIRLLEMATDVLKYMVDSIIDYIDAQDVTNQLQLLKMYFDLDAGLTQIFINYNYFDTNPF